MKKRMVLGLIFIACFLIVFFRSYTKKVNKITYTGPYIEQAVDTATSPELQTNIESKIEEIDELQEVFYAVKPDFSRLDQNKLITIISTGDVMMSRHVNMLSEEKKDYLWMVQDTKDYLSNADITFIIFENPIKTDCDLVTGGMVFCARNKNVESLKALGVDIASLGNNHALDQGPDGLTESEQILNNAGVKTVGVKNPVYIDIKGKKIAFLAYTELSCNDKYLGCIANRQKIANDIKMARTNADLVIPMFHWGVEYTTRITTLQKEVAHLAIESGADLVLGNHPHWIQPIESYKGKLIFYSNGNFIFDQMWSQKTREGLVTKFYFYDNMLIFVELVPTIIEEYGRPVILENAAKSAQLEYIKAISTKPQT
jgi:gamma-polyglutamate biosynthesis protein CapA